MLRFLIADRDIRLRQIVMTMRIVALLEGEDRVPVMRFSVEEVTSSTGAG